jgi:hypothetical protein
VDAVLKSLLPWVVRPRALALTLWARLLACDLFVHGIGGAKYDRITDGIIHRYYRCSPPAFACVSATLRLPLPRHPVNPNDLLNAKRQLRDLQFNPDRYVRNAPADLLEKRADLIRESDRLRRVRGSRTARRDTFLSIRRVNARLLESQPGLRREFLDRVDRIERELLGNAVASSREYFYVLQSRERLARLAEDLIAATRLSG